MDCIHCNAANTIKVGIYADKQRYKCKACGRKFTGESTRTDDVFITLIKVGNRIVFPQRVYNALSLHKGVGMATYEGEIYIVADPLGVKPYLKNTRPEIANAFIAKKIREHFNIGRISIRIYGSIQNQHFKMEYFNTTNIPVQRHIGKRPSIRVSKFDLLAFSRMAAEMMMLEKGDRLIVAKEQNTIYFVVSRDTSAFNLTFSRTGGISGSSGKVGAYLRDHFKVEKEVPFSVELEMVQKDSQTMFRLKLVES